MFPFRIVAYSSQQQHNKHENYHAHNLHVRMHVNQLNYNTSQHWHGSCNTVTKAFNMTGEIADTLIKNAGIFRSKLSCLLSEISEISTAISRFTELISGMFVLFFKSAKVRIWGLGAHFRFFHLGSKSSTYLGFWASFFDEKEVFGCKKSWNSIIEWKGGISVNWK